MVISKSINEVLNCGLAPLKKDIIQLDDSRPKITAVLPVYNKEEYIGSMIVSMRPFVDEIIVVDDCSTDRTAVVAELAGAVVLRSDRKLGRETALHMAFDHISKNSAEIIVTFPAGRTHDPCRIPDIIEPLLKGEADVVNGSILESAQKARMRIAEISTGNQVMVSVVIPAKNEEKTIGTCIIKAKKAFSEMGISGEVIIADNSTDRTPEISRSLDATVVTPDMKGYGYAYIFGMKRACGKYIVIGDADDTYDFLDMPGLLEPLIRGEADFVLGSRFKGEIKPGAMPPLHRYIGSPALNFFLNLFYKTNTSDSHSGFRAFTHEALDRMGLGAHGMEFASEMMIKASSCGLRMREVPITYYPRMGESKLNSFSDGWRHLKFMLLHTPKHVFYIPGFILFALGLGSMLLMSLTGMKIGDIAFGNNSMIAASLSTITGYQLIFLGIFSMEGGRSGGLIGYRRITGFIRDHMSLERGAIVGMLILMSGLFYIAGLISTWVSGGFMDMPMLNRNVLAFSLSILGLQTVSFAFFLNMLADRGK